MRRATLDFPELEAPFSTMTAPGVAVRRSVFIGVIVAPGRCLALGQHRDEHGRAQQSEGDVGGWPGEHGLPVAGTAEVPGAGRLGMGASMYRDATACP